MQTYDTSLRRSLTIQLRVLGALFMREVLTRFGRHNIGFLWLFAEPMMFTLGVTALWTATKAVHGASIPIAAFAITGYSSILLWRNMAARCTSAVTPNFTLLYHRNVKVLDIFAARILLEAAGATGSFLVLSLLFSALGLMRLPEDIVKVVGGWLMLNWFGASLGLLVGVLSEISELVDKIWHPTSYILFPLSGAAFMVEWLPPVMQQFVLYLPMVHGVEYVREGYFGSLVHAHHNLPYMAVVCLCMNLLGLSLARLLARNPVPA